MLDTGPHVILSAAKDLMAIQREVPVETAMRSFAALRMTETPAVTQICDSWY